MKKLNIVQYKGRVKSEPIEFEEFRLVAVNVDKDADENEVMEKSVEKLKEWFSTGYPNCDLIEAVCLPTVM